MRELEHVAAAVRRAVAGEITTLRGRTIEVACGIEDEAGVRERAVGAVGEAIQHSFRPSILSRLQLEDGAATRRSTQTVVPSPGVGCTVDTAAVQRNRRLRISAVAATLETVEDGLGPTAGSEGQHKHGTVAESAADRGCPVEPALVVDDEAGKGFAAVRATSKSVKNRFRPAAAVGREFEDYATALAKGATVGITSALA